MELLCKDAEGFLFPLINNYWTSLSKIIIVICQWRAG